LRLIKVFLALSLSFIVSYLTLSATLYTMLSQPHIDYSAVLQVSPWLKGWLSFLYPLIPFASEPWYSQVGMWGDYLFLTLSLMLVTLFSWLFVRKHYQMLWIAIAIGVASTIIGIWFRYEIYPDLGKKSWTDYPGADTDISNEYILANWANYAALWQFTVIVFAFAIVLLTIIEARKAKKLHDVD